MMKFVVAILPLLLAATAFVFLTLRLRLFQKPRAEGRLLFVSGGVLVTLAAGWQIVRLAPDYPY
ncbi:MAG: hypothetical protein D6800_05525, partial [Candidatus Zixiibacteriota bacterium]